MENYHQVYTILISKLWNLPLPSCIIVVQLSYNCLSEFFIENDLFSSKQPGFEEGDLCITQLLSISHEIYKSLDNGYKDRGVFFYISKVFNKVYRNGTIYELKQNGVTYNLLNIVINFLDAREESVVLSGQYFYAKMLK